MIPSYIANKSPEVRSKWTSVYNGLLSTGHDNALLGANLWLTSHVQEQLVTARSAQVREKLSFKIELSDKEFIKRDSSGEEYIDFILSDNLPDNYNTVMPLSVLERWADSINKDLPVGDIDHELYDELLRAGMSDEQVRDSLKRKPGIAKTVKALVRDGKLWLRAFIDKRYKRIIEKVKGASVEAIVTRGPDGSVIDGDFLGFSFVVNEELGNPRAVVAA